MNLGQLDAAIRFGGVTAILALAWLLFRQRGRVGVPGVLFLPMAICLSGFLIGNTPDPSLRLSGALGAVAHFASGCTVPFLWWFCLACFDRQFRLRGGVLVVGLCWIALAVASRAVHLPVPALSYALISLGLGIVMHLIWRLYAEREGDLIQKRYDARAIVALLLGGLLLIDLLADLLFGIWWRPLAFAMTQNAAILGFSIWLMGRALTVRPSVLSFSDAVQVSRPLSGGADVPEPAVDEQLLQRLATLIDEDRIYLDPDLTFAAFVQRMNAPERTVRKLVNRELGFDHFRSFLNHYRIREARRLLADPRRSADKLIGIALDSGFASLPSFNRVFRATEACTPSQFRDAALSGRLAGLSGDGSEESSAAALLEKRSAVF